MPIPINAQSTTGKIMLFNVLIIAFLRSVFISLLTGLLPIPLLPVRYLCFLLTYITA